MRREVGNGALIVHIAMHAAFDARPPLKSASYLNAENGAVALTPGSLFENPLSADLVILSACETGFGKAVAEGDFLGLPRSFYLTGDRTVLNSRWPVDDAGTLSFMTSAIALRRTKTKRKRLGNPP